MALKAQYNKAFAGFSTLEILLAFAIIILSITAVIGLVFTGQSLAVDSQTNSEALYKAESKLEQARAEASSDFNLLNPIATATEGIYQISLEVNQTDFFTKQITSNVLWQTGLGREQNVRLTSIVTDWQNAQEGNTCSSVLSGDWQRPKIDNFDFAGLIGAAGGTYTISALDAYEGRLYVAVSATSSKTDPTFFTFDISKPGSPVLISTPIDNDSKVLAGIAGVKVSGNYAYVASTSSYSRGQLQIINITTNPPVVVKTYKIPVINAAGASTGLGSSIFYKSGFVYLGLTKTDSENEFNVIDVSDPSNPVIKGGYNLDNGVNAIYVKGNYAYLAHPADTASRNDEQLTVIDVSNPANPVRLSGFYYQDGVGGNGKSLSFIGNNLYFGRTASKISGPADTIPEFYILDASNPADMQKSPLGSLPLATPESVNGLIIRDYLAFFLSSSQFQVWNISKPSDLEPWTNNLPLPGSSAAMDCEGNTFYIASNDSNNKGILSIINPSP